jgi:hypothetical protein
MLLGMSSHVDLVSIRQTLVEECESMLEKQMPTKEKKNSKGKDIAEDDTEMMPPPGATPSYDGTDFLKPFIFNGGGLSGSSGHRKQRFIIAPAGAFDANDRNQYSVLDYGKVADVIIAVFSCSAVDTKGIKIDPEKNAKAIDEHGYQILSLLRG